MQICQLVFLKVELKIKNKNMKQTLKEEYYEHILNNVDYGKVKNSVFKIVYDLSDRRGLSGEWDQIDDEIQEEIIQIWLDIISVEFKVNI